MTNDDSRYDVIWLIRRLFRAFAALADDYLADSGLTAADRAVMEFLYPSGTLTVPELALRYRVSRQHIQVTVNGLVQAGLLSSSPNPKHKRSPLFALSDLGRDTFAEIRRNEAIHVDRLFSSVDDDAIAITRDTLSRVYEQLK